MGGNQRPGVYVKRVQKFLLKPCLHPPMAPTTATEERNSRKNNKKFKQNCKNDNADTHYEGAILWQMHMHYALLNLR